MWVTIILKELGLTPLFVRHQFHIFKAFRAIFFGPCPSFLSALAPKFFKNFSDYSSLFHTNVQLPSCKTHSLHNSFFHKGSRLWNSLPTYLHNLRSRQFCTKVSDLFLNKKKLMHGIYTVAILTQLLSCVCFVYFGHSKLNTDGHYIQICQCGAMTEIHMFLECPSACASRQTVAACGENGREGCEISFLVEHTGLSPCPWLFIMAFPVTPAVLNL